MEAPGHKLAFYDHKNVVGFAHNQQWRPLAAKVYGHHSGLPQEMVSLAMNTVASDHNKLQRLTTANSLFYDFKDVVAYGLNKLYHVIGHECPFLNSSK